MHAHACACACVCHNYPHRYAHTPVRLCAHTRMYAHAHLCVHTCVCMRNQGYFDGNATFATVTLCMCIHKRMFTGTYLCFRMHGVSFCKVVQANSICTFACTYACVFTHACGFVYVCVFAHAYACLRMCMCVCDNYIHRYVHTCARWCAHTHVCRRAHTCMFARHTCMYAGAHLWVDIGFCVRNCVCLDSKGSATVARATICMCMHERMFTVTYLCVHAYAGAHRYMHTCVCTSPQRMCIHVCARMPIWVCTRLRTDVSFFKQECMLACASTESDIHVCAQIYVCAFSQPRALRCMRAKPDAGISYCNNNNVH